MNEHGHGQLVTLHSLASHHNVQNQNKHLKHVQRVLYNSLPGNYLDEDHMYKCDMCSIFNKYNFVADH